MSRHRSVPIRRQAIGYGSVADAQRIQIASVSLDRIVAQDAVEW